MLNNEQDVEQANKPTSLQANKHSIKRKGAKPKAHLDRRQAFSEQNILVTNVRRQLGALDLELMKLTKLCIPLF